MPRLTNRCFSLQVGFNRFTRRAACAAVVGLCLFSTPAFAVDPLPDHIESASPEVQAQYLERLGRESLDEKLKVGRARHATRVATREAIYQHMQAEVANRMAEVSGMGASIHARSPIISFLKPTAIVVGCAIGMIFVVQAWRRKVLN